MRLRRGQLGLVGNAVTAGEGAYSVSPPPATSKLWIQTNTGDYPDHPYGGDLAFANATVLDLTSGNAVAKCRARGRRMGIRAGAVS